MNKMFCYQFPEMFPESGCICSGVYGEMLDSALETDIGKDNANHNRNRRNAMGKSILFAAAACMLFGSFGCSHAPSTADIPSVKNFSLEKYLGTWYEIARMPHSFEQELTDVKAEYTLRTDGRVNVVNSGRQNGKSKRIEGIARMKESDNLGELQVSFFRPFYGDYRIIYLASDYTLAMVTSDTREYLWILARTPVIELATLQECLKLAEKYGFSTGLLQYPNRSLENFIGRQKNGGAL